MSDENMKKGTAGQLNSEQAELLSEFDTLADDQMATSDVAEITDWNGVQQGLFYRPIKQQVTLRLDADLIAWFKEQSKSDNGRGYQTLINRALREYVAQRVRNR